MVNRGEIVSALRVLLFLQLREMLLQEKEK
jgi:hypothetical protein